MTQDTAIKLFNDKQIRTLWDNDQEKWFFSIVDVVGVLTESPNPRKYWSVLKTRLKAEGSQLATNCSQLKMLSSDGKYYKTDVADTEPRYPRYRTNLSASRRRVRRRQPSRFLRTRRRQSCGSEDREVVF